jgi:glycosyltransferase involved in cell wall biosynthesis
MAAATRRTLRRADGLLADVQRDLALAAGLGFDGSKPKLLVPGNGGVRGEIFRPAAQPASEPRIINPRGLRAYVRNDVFFEAVALASKQIDRLQVDCPAMAGETQAEAWVRRFGLGKIVNLLPSLPPGELAEAYRHSAVMVSPSTHDGTPNTLLEAMACGLLPVAGDLDSIREWIMDGENGLLVDANDAGALAAAMVHGLQDRDLRTRAATMNAGLIAERADYASGMRKAEALYRQVLAAHV